MEINFKHGIEGIYDEREYHYHTYYQMFFLVSGTADFTLEGKKYQLIPGNLIFVKPCHQHRLNIKPETQCEWYCVNFYGCHIPKELLRSVENLGGGYNVPSDSFAQFFTDTQRLIDGYHGGFPFSVAKCALHHILFHFCSQYSCCDYTIEHPNNTKIIDFINKNLTIGFSLEEMCKSLNISESFACGQFMAYMNLTIMSYVRLKRIALADSKMNEGAKPMDIYTKCGFADYSTFFRTYKKVMMYTPSQKKYKHEA